jgi:diguanylate cyclase (GGDEF)-like protein
MQLLQIMARILRQARLIDEQSDALEIKVKSKFYTANFLVAAAYFIGGQAGLLLAIPPSNAAAVWPAAGVALAAIVICGTRVLPGILLGGILVQTTAYLDAASTEKIISSLIIGTVISAGAMCQAWVGAKFVRRVIEHDEALLKERSIILFCLLAGPLSCIISASVGISTLWFEGILTVSDIPLSWGTWWIGDSIGVLVFSPVILCFFAKPRSLWKQRISSVAIPLCILTSVAFVAFKFSYQQEMQYIEDEFERNAMRFTSELRNSIDSNIEATNELKEFFDNSNEVSAEIFNRYTNPKLSRHPEIKALEWIPLVHHKDRVSFEARLGTQITIPNQEREMVGSPVKEFYYPIQYLEPYTDNENALGFDIRNNPIALEAAESACFSGKVAVTDAIKLVQETREQIGIVFYAPVYKKAKSVRRDTDCETLSGFVASVFRLENEISNIHKRLPELKLTVSLKNHSRVFYSDTPATDKTHSIPNQFQFNRTYTFPVANQQWQLILSPAIGFISLYSPWTIWLIIVGGLLISGISGVGLLMLTGRTLQTEDKIKLRTEELNNEVKERKNTAIQLTLEKKYLEMITQDYTLQNILDSLTIDIEEIVPDVISSILLLDSSEKHLKHGSAPSLPSGYIEAIDGVEIGPNVGSCGTAAYLNKQIVVSDIAFDPLWADYRDIALKYGLKACWSTPITVANGKVLGTFAFYFHTTKEPDTKLIDLTNRMANIVAITILRKQTEEQLTFHASHDALTGLVNRREFERRAARLLSTVNQEDNDEHALCFMDLDQFKVVNDSCGHTAGDEMLRQLTMALQNVVRKRDTLARLGGDEFGVLMEHCSLDDAHRVATSIQKTIQDYQFLWEGRSFKVGVSIGLVPITEATVTLTQLLKDADAACYMAKELGRNRIHIYHHEDENLAKRSGEMQWVARLNQALEEDRFCLYAQTIVPLDGSPDTHYELLLRMIDKKGKTIPPGAFLPAAERYNLIAKLDHWVIKNAFALLADNPHFLKQINFCSINLSGQSLTDPDILDFVISQLDESGVRGEKICFEITETAAISNLSMAMKFISTLKRLGCRFALDDFGSGLSSFAYLKNLSVDYLKIDGMFVKDIVDDPIDRAMVKSINEIGQVMGMQTIAEFVENDVIKGMLKEIGVNYAQGYGIGKPRLFHDLLKNEFKVYA